MYEYKAVEKAISNASRTWHRVIDELNELGKNGWRVISTNDKRVIIMERDICHHEEWETFSRSLEQQLGADGINDRMVGAILQDIKGLEGNDDV